MQKSIQEGYLLFIEPSAKTARRPVIDQLTCQMTAAFLQSKANTPQAGFHECACGTKDGATSYTLPNGLILNDLCVHYLMWHRREIPADQLQLVKQLKHGQKYPTFNLAAPPRKNLTAAQFDFLTILDLIGPKPSLMNILAFKLLLPLRFLFRPLRYWFPRSS